MATEEQLKQIASQTKAQFEAGEITQERFDQVKTGLRNAYRQMQSAPAVATPSPSTMAEEVQSATPDTGGTMQALGDLKDLITGESRHTEESRRLPRTTQITPGKNMLEKLKNIPAFGRVFLTSSSPEEFAKGYEEAFPGSEARLDKKGNMIIRTPEGVDTIVNRPGFNFTDVLKLGTEAAKYAPAAKGASMVQGIKRIPASIGLSGLTATINEALSPEFELDEVAIEAALGGMGESAGLIFDRLKPGLKTAFMGLQKTDTNALKATTDFIEQTAGEVADVAPGKIQKAADQSIESKRAALAKEAGPLYAQARKNNPDVDISAVRQEMDALLSEYGEYSPFRQVALEAFKPVKGAENFSQLIGAQKALNRQIRALKDPEDIAIVQRLKSKLVGAMDEASPEYAKARGIYAEGMPDVEVIQNNVLGAIARKKERDYKGITEMFFQRGRSKKEIKQALALLGDQTPGVKDDIVGMEIMRRLDSVVDASSEAAEPSIKGLYQALAGSKEAVRRNKILFENFATPEQKKNLEQLFALVRNAEMAISRVRPNQAIEDLSTKMLFGIPRAAAAPFNRANAQKHLEVLIEAVSNPAVAKTGASKRFRALNLSKPSTRERNTQQALRILTQLTDEIMETLPDEGIQEPTQKETE